MFCENVVTLVGWICKSYSTFGLFNMYYSSLFLFFIFILSQISICALFSIVFVHCSYSVFHCSSTVLFWLATLSFLFIYYFFFFKVLNSSYNTKRHCSYIYIYIYIFLVFYLYFFSLLYISLYIHCFCTVCAL